MMNIQSLYWNIVEIYINYQFVFYCTLCHQVRLEPDVTKFYEDSTSILFIFSSVLVLNNSFCLRISYILRFFPHVISKLYGYILLRLLQRSFIRIFVTTPDARTSTILTISHYPPTAKTF